MVYSTFLKLTSSADQAEDASQSVFLLLAERAPRIRVDKTLANWLFATCRNVCRGIARDERRRMKRELPLNESTAQACDPHIPDFSLIEALGRLRRDEREAVLLRFFNGLSLAEVGGTQGISEDAARMRIARALARMRAHFAATGLALSPELIRNALLASRATAP